MPDDAVHKGGERLCQGGGRLEGGLELHDAGRHQRVQSGHPDERASRQQPPHAGAGADRRHHREGSEGERLSAGEVLKDACISPGASLQAVLRALGEYLAVAKAPVCMFLRMYLKDQTLPRLEGSSPHGPWPMPNPLFELVGCQSRPRSGRRHGRWRRCKAAHVWAALQCGLLSLMTLGFDRSSRLASVPWRPASISALQLKLARGWSEKAKELGCVSVQAFTGGRMSLAQRVRCLRATFAYDLRGVLDVDKPNGEGDDSQLGSATAVVSLRLDLPGKGAFLLLDDLLSDATKAKWCNPDFITKIPELPLPKPVFMYSKIEWLRTLRLLKDADLVVFWGLEFIARDANGEILRAGIFGVLKGGGRIRLIIDRRPANAHEINLPGLLLPHACCFTRFRLGVKEVMRLNLRDASNYYLLLRVPAARLPFQAAGEPVSRAWVEAGLPEVSDARAAAKIFAAPDLCQPVLTCLLPGDLNAVCIGEEAHYNLIMRGDGLRDDERIVYGQDAPAGGTWGGIYIDDLATAQRLSVGQFNNQTPLRDTTILEVSDGIYKKFNVPQKPQKQLSGVPGGHVWGGQLSTSIGLSVEKLCELMFITLGIIGAGWVTKLDMQKVTGHWGFPLQFRRVLWCVYAWCASSQMTYLRPYQTTLRTNSCVCVCLATMLP